MNTFSQAVAAQKSAETTRTENGMKTFVTSDSKVLGADPEEFNPYNMMMKTNMSERYDY